MPQVLKIDHDDSVSLSGDESVESSEEELESPQNLFAFHESSNWTKVNGTGEQSTDGNNGFV